MIHYTSKEELVAAIRKRADLFILEFDDIDESDKDRRLEEGERTPFEMLAYQLGWLTLLRTWEEMELAGETPEMPAPGVKWNRLGVLHERFYETCQDYALEQLAQTFRLQVDDVCRWLDGLDDAELFKPGGRRWAQSTSSNWPVWKWVHTNTVAPFTSFRTKIRKWKKRLASR